MVRSGFPLSRFDKTYNTKKQSFSSGGTIKAILMTTSALFTLIVKPLRRTKYWNILHLKICLGGNRFILLSAVVKESNYEFV